MIPRTAIAATIVPRPRSAKINTDRFALRSTQTPTKSPNNRKGTVPAAPRNPISTSCAPRTNAALVAKTGRKWSEVIQDILALVDGPISLEVTTTAADEMIKQGRQLAKLHKNVVVKIQMTTEGLKAIKALSSEGVKINTTLIFSANQAILAAKAGAKYVSPFIGRLDDMGQEGMEVIREIAEIFGNYDWDCEILVASIRHPLHVIEAARLGADIVTLPFDVLKKMTQHALTDVGLKRFLDDWQKVPK